MAIQLIDFITTGFCNHKIKLLPFQRICYPQQSMLHNKVVNFYSSLVPLCIEP